MRGMAGLAEVFTEMRMAERKTATKQDSTIKRGVVHGTCVSIGSASYPYTVAVDINIVDGMYVWCEIYGNSTAVIVGA